MGLGLDLQSNAGFLDRKALKPPYKARDSPPNIRDRFPFLPISSLTITCCHNFVTMQLASSATVPRIVGQILDLKDAFV
jgi:hypothetical protein